MELSRSRALALLSQCDGDHIWSVEVCRESGVPERWIDDLVDTYESGFRSDRETIYVDDRITNQYNGVRDVDLAIRLARTMGLDVDRLQATSLGSRSLVQAIKDAIMEGE